MSVFDFGDDFIRIFRSSCSSLLLRFLTKKIQENMPTVKINNAAAAIVMPAICAIVRFNSPCALTPSAPALTVACVISVVGIGNAIVVGKGSVTELVFGACEEGNAVVSDCDVTELGGGMAPGMPSQMLV